MCLLALLFFKTAIVVYRHPQTFADRDSTQELKQQGYLFYYGRQFADSFHRENKNVQWPGKINPVVLSPLSVDHRGKNIIILQVESLDESVLDLQIDGRDVTPNLRKLASESLYFPSFLAQHRAGGSCDAELSSLASLLPLQTHSGFYSLRKEKVISLCDVLTKQGYTCVGMHGNSGAFFNRQQNFYKMGFDLFLSEPDFRGEAAGWYSKDKAFFDQVIEKLEPIKKPFLLYLITMQSHGPFQNYSPGNAVFSGIGRKQAAHYFNVVRASHYFNVIHEVDEAIGSFVEQLKVQGYLNNTILVIFGDHTSRVQYEDWAAPSRYGRLSQVELVPLIIHGTQLPPREYQKVGSHLDIAPTLLHLLNIPDENSWLGSSLLDASDGKVILNYSPPILVDNQNGKVFDKGDFQRYGRHIAYSESVMGL